MAPEHRTYGNGIDHPECKMDENGGKKKLSKRDMGAKMDDYREMGIVD